MTHRRDEAAGWASAFAALVAGILGISHLLPQAPLIPAVSQAAPYFAAALLAFAVPLVVARRFWRAGGCAVLAAGILASLHLSVTAVSAEPKSRDDDAVFTLVSFNALHSNESAPQAVPFLLRTGADAILLMEADALRGSMRELAATYPYRMGCDDGAKCDTVLLSKYPPTLAWKASLGAVFPERYIQFGVNFRGRPLTIVGAHLTKPYFDDFALIELGVLAERVNRLKEPTILAGDFNSAQWAPALKRLSEATGLRFSEFFVPTWPAWAGAAGLPIDHVLARSASILELSPFPQSFGSNHRGLIARIAIPARADEPMMRP